MVLICYVFIPVLTIIWMFQNLFFVSSLETETVNTYRKVRSQKMQPPRLISNYQKSPKMKTLHHNCEQEKKCLKIIVSVDKNMCIGKDGLRPWDLPSEFEYLLSMTTNPQPGLEDAVILGRKTWETLDKYSLRPYPHCLNIVLSSGDVLNSCMFNDTVVGHSLDEAIEIVQSNPQIEEVWVLGGSLAFKSAILSPFFHRLYIVYIDGVYDCDAYFPFTREELESNKEIRVVPPNKLKDPRVPIGIQTDPKDGVKYKVVVYERKP